MNKIKSEERCKKHPCYFPMVAGEFWKQIKSTVEEVVNAKFNQTSIQPPTDHLPEKALLKASDFCTILQVSKPTIYDWLRQNKLISFKIKSRRYFLRTDIELMIRNQEDVGVITTQGAAIAEPTHSSTRRWSVQQ